jgi:hypothetical protein
LKSTVPPLPGSTTVVSRFSKSHAYVVVPAELTMVWVLPLGALTIHLHPAFVALSFTPAKTLLFSFLRGSRGKVFPASVI